jgi:hypothetical protein
MTNTNKNTNKDVKMVNLTPHEVNIILLTGTITIEPSGIVPRLTEKSEQIGEVVGIPVFTKSFGDVQDMPNEEKGVIYIVSALAAGVLKHRNDVYIPNGTVRDEKGRIVGCTSLAKV